MTGLGILCPGQGNQHPDMFDKLLGCTAAESSLQSASAVFGCHPIDYLQQLSEQELFSNHSAQLLIGTLQMATWAELRDKLPHPKVFAGYSMGELAAYGCAGALSLTETLTLMQQRAALMDAAVPQASGLLALRGLNRQQIDALCSAVGIEIAILNSPDHFVLGGPDAGLKQVEDHPLASKATTCKRLQVTVPSHTSLLTAASSEFAACLNESALKAPPHPVLAGVSGTVVRSREQAVEALQQQISHPINWIACMQTAVELGCSVFLELGPGNALAKIMQDLFPAITVRSVEDFRSLKGVATWVEKQCL